MQQISPALSGSYYFFYGWKLVTLPGIRRFIILPIISNIILMGLGFWWLYRKIFHWVTIMVNYLPEWLHWLSYIAGIIIALSIAVIFGYLFSSITNLIAAPFNSLLAEKLESILTKQPPPTTSFLTIVTDIPRVIKRELQKLIKFVLWAIPLLLLYLIPVIGQTLAPLLWLIFSSWMLGVQYLDYSFDNHKIALTNMHHDLANHRSDVMQFGILVNLFTIIPILNLIIMPIAICGATAMWVDHYCQNNSNKLSES